MTIQAREPRATRQSGIATTYHGTRFRSRLEARWAAFFDLVGWRWTYEPIDADGYIPDFLLHGPEGGSMLVEIGPCEYLSEFSEKATKPLAAIDRPVLVLGIAPDLPAPLERGAYVQGGYLTDDGHGSGTAVAMWARCTECSTVGVFHEFGAWTLRPCGHYDGDHYLGMLPNRELAELWADAGNRVQWRPR